MIESLLLRWTCISAWSIPLGLWYGWLLLTDHHPNLHMLPLWLWFFATGAYYADVLRRGLWPTAASACLGMALITPLISSPFIGVEASITLACGLAASTAYGLQFCWMAEQVSPSTSKLGLSLRLLLGLGQPLAWAGMSAGILVLYMKSDLLGPPFWWIASIFWALGLAVLILGTLKARSWRRLARMQLAESTLQRESAQFIE